MLIQRYASSSIELGGGEAIFGAPRVFVLQRFIETKKKPEDESDVVPTVTTYGVLTTVLAGAETAHRVQYFDPTTGASLGSFDGVLVGEDFLTAYATFSDREGGLWLLTNFAGEDWVRYDPQTWTRTGESIDPNDFTPTLQHPIALDKKRDLLLSCTIAATNVGYLSVYSFSTKERLYTIPLGSNGRHILLEDDERCYVVCDHGVVILLNYVHSQILGTYRIAYADVHQSAALRFAWDPYFRRILVVGAVEDAGIYGYFPIPVATGLTRPIPLQVPRRGRTVRVVSRAYGDAGEGVAGKRVLAIEDGPGAVSSPRVVSGPEGYAFFNLRCDNAGEQTFDVETEQ